MGGRKGKILNTYKRNILACIIKHLQRNLDIMKEVRFPTERKTLVRK